MCFIPCHSLTKLELYFCLFLGLLFYIYTVLFYSINPGSILFLVPFQPSLRHICYLGGCCLPAVLQYALCNDRMDIRVVPSRLLQQYLYLQLLICVITLSIAACLNFGTKQ